MVDTEKSLVLFLLGVHCVLVAVCFFPSYSEVVHSRGKCSLFHSDFVFQLRDLMGSNSEFALELRHLVLALNQVLRVEVTVGSNGLVQVLLSFQFAFEVNVFLLKLADQVLFQLDFLNHLHEVTVGFGGFKGELVTLFFELGGFGRKLVLDFAIRRGLFTHRPDRLLVSFCRVFHVVDLLLDHVKVGLELFFL